MRKAKRKPPISCQHFSWRLFQRNGVWYADGRGGTHELGKHSLGTREKDQALDNLRRLDQHKAVELGIAEPASERDHQISIAEGWRFFLDHCDRPEVMGGVSDSTQKRYRAVRDKHVVFCDKYSLNYWENIGKKETQRYGKWLEKRGYADRSQYLELTLIKSVVKWLVEESYLPESCQFRLPLRRPQGTDTYCYDPVEVSAMIEHCRADSSLNWLGDVIVALICTGLRISELASLRRSDVDLETNTIQLTDERSSSRRRAMGTERRTKGRRGRSIPINPELRTVLKRLKPHQDGRLLHGPRGGRLKPDTVRNILIRDVIEPLKKRFPTPEGEIGFEHGRVHSFRHYFVSQAFRNGVSEGEIMDWVGHRDSKMVAHYRHLRNDDSQRKMKQIDFVGTGLDSGGPDPCRSIACEKEAVHGENLTQPA